MRQYSLPLHLPSDPTISPAGNCTRLKLNRPRFTILYNAPIRPRSMLIDRDTRHISHEYPYGQRRCCAN